MRDSLEVIAYDIGTTGAKTCLYRFSPSGAAELLASRTTEYPLSFLANGGVEQDTEHWWDAMGRGTRAVLRESGLGRERIRAISFCCQMQGLVLVDGSGRALRPAMSYMDQRGTEQKRRGIGKGVKIAGMNAAKLVPSLIIAGGVSASVKDPVWKYAWVRDNEPALFANVYKWLDAKEYLVGRCTGRFAMTPDSANATFLYDTRPSKLNAEGVGSWSPLLCRLFQVEIGHLPEVVSPVAVVGKLLPASSKELGLEEGTPVFGGGGDLSLISLGSGAVGLHETHVYMGTSGWVSAVTGRRIVDTDSFIASILGARPGYYNYISELETSGKCMEWVSDHLVLDEIGIYLGRRLKTGDPEEKHRSLFEFLDESIASVPPGSGGLIFAPWLHGNRSPFEDPSARGMFFNIGLGTGKRAMVRAVAEGIALHNRWQLEAIRKKVPAKGPLRFVGGGARSKEIAKIMASALGETVETISSPHNAGALGAAILCARGTGWISSLDETKRLVPAAGVYEPDPEAGEAYEKAFEAFKKLYFKNRSIFRDLNG